LGEGRKKRKEDARNERQNPGPEESENTKKKVMRLQNEIRNRNPK
jgi:hypothetical protein